MTSSTVAREHGRVVRVAGAVRKRGLNRRAVVDVDAVADQCPRAVGKVEVDVVHRARFRVVETVKQNRANQCFVAATSRACNVDAWMTHMPGRMAGTDAPAAKSTGRP